MKSLIRYKFITLCIFFFCSIGNIEVAKAQIFPVLLADTVTNFGPYQEIMIKGQLVKVRTKLNRHFGTTCQFEVEITNNSTKQLKSSFGFVSSSSNNIYEANSAYINLKPDYYAVYKLELRECLKRGKKNAIISCMSCNPRLGFL